MMSKPFFSILILFWKSEQYLPESLNALDRQTFRDFEVILLNNGADNPPDPELLAQHPKLNLRVLHSDKNLGFTGGNNLAARHARGEYLVLLNGDAFPEPDWLAKLHQAAQDTPNHCFASRLINARQAELLDGEWNVYHASGLALRKNHHQPVGKSSQRPRFVISACAAASAYPRPAFELVGGFDEDFFAYMEDIDLDLRLQLAGFSFIYLPDAIVHHVGSGSTASRSAFSTYYGQRNLIWTFVKNMPGFLFYLLLPVHIFFNLLYLLASLFMFSGKELRQGKMDALKKLPQMLAKRKIIQSRRKISLFQFAKLLDWNPFTPLIKLTYR